MLVYYCNVLVYYCNVLVHYCNVLAYYCSFHYHWHVYHYILLICSFWACPPTISPWTRFYRFFSAALTEDKLVEGILFTKRLLILMIIIDFMVKLPIIGVCWFLIRSFTPHIINVKLKIHHFPIFWLQWLHRAGKLLRRRNENFLAP